MDPQQGPAFPQSPQLLFTRLLPRQLICHLEIQSLYEMTPISALAVIPDIAPTLNYHQNFSLDERIIIKHIKAKTQS